jgi:hypothetical protein
MFIMMTLWTMRVSGNPGQTIMSISSFRRLLLICTPALNRPHQNNCVIASEQIATSSYSEEYGSEFREDSSDCIIIGDNIRKDDGSSRQDENNPSALEELASVDKCLRRKLVSNSQE